MSHTVRKLSVDQVREVLEGEGYESVLEHIEERGGMYHLKADVSELSKLPSYHYALGITLMALGNNEDAEKACGSLWRYLGPAGQTDVSYILGRFLSKMYDKSK